MNRTDSYQLNFVANYNRTFGKHTIGALFSVERSERNYEYVRYYREDPLEVNNGEWNTATGKMDGLTERSESGLLSYIGRVNYSYNDRYMMDSLFVQMPLLNLHLVITGGYSLLYHWVGWYLKKIGLKKKYNGLNI